MQKNMPARKRPAVGILWNDRRHIKFFVWTWSVYDISETDTAIKPTSGAMIESASI